MTRPLISVLLPTFNSAAIVRETLESIKWADEILVVDSFSTDETSTSAGSTEHGLSSTNTLIQQSRRTGRRPNAAMNGSYR